MEKVDFREYLRTLNGINDLLELYLRALPVFAYLCDADKLLFFKYSRRKKCFDLKIGIEKSSLINVLKDGFFSYDLDIIFKSDFNLRLRKWGSSCNDAIRSFVMSYAKKEEKIIKKDDLPLARFKKLFDESGFDDEALYIPLVARDEIVGFLLISPACDISNIEIYREAFACVLDKLLLKKSVENLEVVVATEKERSCRDERVYEIGKTAMMVAHEMKNSLIGIMGLFDRLSEYINKSEHKALKYRDIIRSQLEKLYNFTLDMNKFSRVSESPKVSKIDLAEIIDNSIEMASAISDNVKFSVSISDEASWVYADKDQLEQVFLNLFKNSIEAKKRGKVKISISVSKEKDNIIIRIKDNSGGVDNETLKNMLKPFYTTKSYGTGLGLAIVRNIIENYEGEIYFRNVPGGLECIIKLPIKNMEDKNG